jgi:hypothetical protein
MEPINLLFKLAIQDAESKKVTPWSGLVVVHAAFADSHVRARDQHVSRVRVALGFSKLTFRWVTRPLSTPGACTCMWVKESMLGKFHENASPGSRGLHTQSLRCPWWHVSLACSRTCIDRVFSRRLDCRIRLFLACCRLSLPKLVAVIVGLCVNIDILLMAFFVARVADLSLAVKLVFSMPRGIPS